MSNALQDKNYCILNLKRSLYYVHKALAVSVKLMRQCLLVVSLLGAFLLVILNLHFPGCCFVSSQVSSF